MADQKSGAAGGACYCINLRRAANALTDYYDRKMSEAGITVNQYSVLSNIRKIQPCSAAELSRNMRLERTTLVRNMKVLYNAGLIKNEAAQGNRRGKICLTDAGEKAVKAASDGWRQAQKDIETYLGTENLSKLTESLAALEKMNLVSKETAAGERRGK